ncbi:MAG TPA: beta-phosphoglucomutase family hydrolase [Burkholderiales bacterium]|nr:beta-phosphoglucomutase family hydrolase [Burkholderiales bacterium]
MGDFPADVISRERFDAVLLDMDGVLTDTASVHASAWKRMFDEFLRARATASGERFVPFDIDSDYARHVDGKPRTDGLRDFLRARGITLPEGTPDDPPQAQTVHGLGKRKDQLVNDVIAAEGVRVFPGSVPLLERLRAAGIRTAVVTSSQNRARVLEAAGLGALFDVAVDGITIVERGLAGKPAPDMFLEAARALGVDPARAVVVEDAISGVEAGARGGFGLVVGVARKGDAAALAAHGAQRVVASLSELMS